MTVLYLRSLIEHGGAMYLLLASRILNFLSKTYYYISMALAISVSLILALIVFAQCLSFYVKSIPLESSNEISLSKYPEYSKAQEKYVKAHDKMIKSVEDLKFTAENQETIYLLYIASMYILILLLNSKIFENISKFCEMKSNNSLPQEQKAMLKLLPRLILVTYSICIFFEMSTYFMPELQALINKYPALPIDFFMFYLIPDFGTPLGLLFAFIIYIYSKNLSEQEAALDEIDYLKKEADLVI